MEGEGKREKSTNRRGLDKRAYAGRGPPAARRTPPHARVAKCQNSRSACHKTRHRSRATPLAQSGNPLRSRNLNRRRKLAAQKQRPKSELREQSAASAKKVLRQSTIDAAAGLRATARARTTATAIDRLRAHEQSKEDY
eukprot:1395945-Pleurochrysis_carterae.AAC.1